VKEGSRYRVDHDDIGIVLKLDLPLGNGVAIGNENPLHDITHGAAVHGNVTVTDASVSHSLHDSIYAGAIASLDHDGILGSFYLSDCFWNRYEPLLI